MATAVTEAPGALTKSLSLLATIVQDGGGRSLSELAEDAAIPLSTAHRLAVGLEQSGFLLRVGRGRYVAGPTLMRLAAVKQDWGAFAARASRSALTRLSRETGKTVHLGVLEEGMMTYLLKIGDRRGDIVSRQGMQLEAYCSGLGKALLAHLPAQEQEAYLAAGPFVRLTPTTITEPDDLRDEFARIRERGFALDDAELSPGLGCIAVPIRNTHGVLAAISLIMTHSGEPYDPADYFPALEATAREIERKLFPYDARV